MSRFYNSNNDEILCSKILIEGATPHVDPKILSNSEIQFQSEISNMESIRSINQETKKKNKLIQKNSQIFSLKFQQPALVNSKKQIQQSLFKMENSQDGKLKQVLNKQMLKKLKDNLLQNAHILSHNMYEEKKPILNYLFQDYVIQDGKQLKKNKIANSLEKLLFFQVFLPQDNFVKYWNLFSILFSFFTLWFSPFIISFQLLQNLSVQQTIVFIFIFLLIDGLITCNKAYLKQGELVISRKDIINNYLRNQVLNDFLNLIIWILMYNGIEQFQIVEMLSILQIIIIINIVYKKINSFVDYLYLNGNLSEVLDLIFLIISLYYFVHIIGCFWHYLAILGQQLNEISWIQKYSLEDQTNLIKYDYAVYWATMTMVTVGYGDITASNPIEIVFSNFTMFISSFVFAYSMNSIGIIIKNLYDVRNLCKRQLILINAYMKNNLVDDSISNRVRNYLKNQVDHESKNNSIEAQQIIDNLPHGLRDDVNINIKTRILQNMKLLVSNFSKQTQSQIIQKLEQVGFIPNDIIYDPNGLNIDQYLYYLDQGSVSLVEVRTQKIIQEFKEGDTLGEHSFISGLKQKFKLISTSYCQLYRISRQELLTVLQNNQKDKEIFYSLQDQLLYLSDYSLINKKCNICHKFDHQNSDCFIISYKPNLEKLVKIQEFLFQPRNKTNRNERQKLKVINSIQGIQNTILQFQQCEVVSNQNETQTVISGTKRIKQQYSTHRQSDNKIELQEPSLLSEQSPEIQLDKKTYRKPSSNFTGKFNIQNLQSMDNKDAQRKISIAILKESTQNPEYSSQQIIQLRSIKNLSNTAIQELDDHIKQIKFIDIDKGFEFQNYLPQNNLENVILNYNKQKLKFLPIYSKIMKQSLKYTFYYKIAKLASQMRMISAPITRRILKCHQMKKLKK